LSFPSTRNVLLILNKLMAQVMKLSYFPQIKVVHTSNIFHGQLFVPIINWLLMLGSVLAAAIAKNVKASS